MNDPESLGKLIESFLKLPGIGQKTATRLAFYTLSMKEEEITAFATALLNSKRDLTFCTICGNLTEEVPCYICRWNTRDKKNIAVVEQVKDVAILEKMREYHGLYHVLHGVLSPMDGTGPEDLFIPSLIKRLQENIEVKEIIIATNATIEGEATAMYLAQLIKPSGIKVTRLAHGLAVG